MGGEVQGAAQAGPIRVRDTSASAITDEHNWPRGQLSVALRIVESGVAGALQ